MTLTTWLLLGTLALAGLLVCLALLASEDRHLERRPLPLPAERPEWSTDPRMRVEYLPRHDGWIAPLVKDDRFEGSTRRIRYRV